MMILERYVCVSIVTSSFVCHLGSFRVILILEYLIKLLF